MSKEKKETVIYYTINQFVNFLNSLPDNRVIKKNKFSKGFNFIPPFFKTFSQFERKRVPRYSSSLIGIYCIRSPKLNYRFETLKPIDKHTGDFISNLSRELKHIHPHLSIKMKTVKKVVLELLKKEMQSDLEIN
jgi:hypothetical protein